MSVKDSRMVNVLEEATPFELTDDQVVCVDEILKDLSGETPMLRILQGDVGTGKTIVAFMAMFAAYGSGESFGQIRRM